jgi:type IV secretory pathway protease TraF
VIAKEGQKVEIKNGDVKVDGQPPAVVVSVGQVSRAPIVVPRGCLFLVSSASMLDSMTFGPIPIRSVRGQVPQ